MSAQIEKDLQGEQIKNKAMLLILLLQAERAWAYAEELKEASNEGELRKRHHRVAKLKRSVKWSHNQALIEISTA